MKAKSIWLGVILCALLFSCKEDEVRAPYGYDDQTPPQEVSEVAIKSIAGGAVLKYQVPDDPDLAYVKALFEAKEGEVREVRSSRYVDSLKIEGIGDTNEHEVKVYTVDRSENVSRGITVRFVPDTPPVVNIRESLNARVDWGGFSLDFENAGKDAISIMVYYENEETEGQTLFDIYYTEQQEGPLAVRGLAPLHSKFMVKVKDRWENESAPYEFELTPLEEELLDATRFKEMYIPGDVRWTFFGGSWQAFFDDNYSNYNFAHTDYPTPFPHSTTIDMGATVQLSRMKLWQRMEQTDFYAHGCPRHFEIYGCPEDRDPFNEDNYELLLDGHLEKPSGGEFADPNTAEDILAAQEGHEFPFPNELMKPVRYVRLVSLASWSGMECTRITELKFWGQYIGKEEAGEE